MPRATIPLMETVVQLARAHVDHDEALGAAIKVLEDTKERNRREAEEWLERNGDVCIECGRKFRPLFNGWSPFCSIGCRFAK